MTTLFRRPLAGAVILGATAFAILPAAAAPSPLDQGASPIIKISSWGSRASGRDDTYGYGYGYPRYGYGYNGYGYNQYRGGYGQPYGYAQQPVEGYGYQDDYDAY